MTASLLTFFSTISSIDFISFETTTNKLINSKWCGEKARENWWGKLK